jgi:hypothetical protein
MHASGIRDFDWERLTIETARVAVDLQVAPGFTA